MMIEVFPQIALTPDARALRHGEVVLTRQGERGLVWKPCREGQSLPVSSSVLLLRTMKHQPLYDAALNEIYIARLSGSLVLRVDTSSLNAEVQKIVHGDIAYSATMLPQATEPLLVLNDAREGGLMVFHFRMRLRDYTYTTVTSTPSNDGRFISEAVTMKKNCL